MTRLRSEVTLPVKAAMPVREHFDMVQDRRTALIVCEWEPNGDATAFR